MAHTLTHRPCPVWNCDSTAAAHTRAVWTLNAPRCGVTESLARAGGGLCRLRGPAENRLSRAQNNKPSSDHLIAVARASLGDGSSRLPPRPPMLL
eukprot:scaffold34076_cov101-Isochrysis_galbana.AAC.1